jgi:hypothetical protein
MEPSSQNQDRIDDLEQKAVEDKEAEQVKGGATAPGEPTLIRVPSPRKIDPCWIVPCI